MHNVTEEAQVEIVKTEGGAERVVRGAWRGALCRHRHRVRARYDLLAASLPRPGGRPIRARGRSSIRCSDLDLAPLLAFLGTAPPVKVFHAARQDVEIFHHLGGVIPTPLYDTQIAAMVCGYGELVGYETLVKSIAKANIDKSARFTDWRRRPLEREAARLCDRRCHASVHGL